VAAWQDLLRAYLAGRVTLSRAFVLIDARHGVKPVDHEIMDLLDRAAVTFQVVLTKIDKPKTAERARVSEALGRDLSAPLLAGASLEAESTPQLLTLRQQRGLRGDGWKVIEDVASGYAVYYDLAADPDEQDPKPARSAAPDRLEELEAAEAAAERHADGLRWSDGEGAALSPDLEERLRELGYLD